MLSPRRSRLGFPAIRLADDAPEVSGFPFISRHLDDDWPRLDEFEGEQYERVITTVRRSKGQLGEAHVYVHNTGPTRA